MALGYFCCHHDYAKKIAKLSDQEVGRLFRALLEYSEFGKTQELTGRESVAFDFIAWDIDRAKESYEEKCRKLQANGSKRKQKQADALQEQEQKQEQEQEQKDIPPCIPPEGGSKRRFVPPTVEEVRAYCLERGNLVDAQRFVDHYTANGWKIGGKSAMKDWKAAVRTWEHNGVGAGRPMNRSTGFETGNPFAELLEEARR